MISLIVAALLLSIDSVVVSFALGTCRIERRHRHRVSRRRTRSLFLHPAMQERRRLTVPKAG